MHGELAIDAVSRREAPRASAEQAVFHPLAHAVVEVAG
jgi:hypothetical protein